MRILVALLLLASFAAFGARTASVTMRLVDLDKPGALEALKRDRPQDYSRVLRAADEVQAVPIESRGQHGLFLDEEKPDPTRRRIETSDPAKTKITVPAGNVLYSLTVLYLKHPPSLLRTR